VFEDVILGKLKLEEVSEGIKPAIIGLMARADESFSGMQYREALALFRNMLKKTVPDEDWSEYDVLQSLFAYANVYSIKGDKVVMFGERGQTISTISNGTIVKQVLAETKEFWGKTCVKIKFGRFFGYIPHECLE
jgi:hypothetical protein